MITICDLEPAEKIANCSNKSSPLVCLPLDFLLSPCLTAHLNTLPKPCSTHSMPLSPSMHLPQASVHLCHVFFATWTLALSPARQQQPQVSHLHCTSLTTHAPLQPSLSLAALAPQLPRLSVTFLHLKAVTLILYELSGTCNFLLASTWILIFGSQQEVASRFLLNSK